MVLNIFESIENISQENLEWDVIFHGEAIDDRGKTLLKYLNKKSKCQHQIYYDPERFELYIDGIICENIESLTNLYLGKKILIESTTLGVNEILKLFFNLDNSNVNIIYIQPKEYKKDIKDALSSYTNFDLSDSFKGFHPIIERMIEITGDTKIKLVIMLGYESYRIDRLFETFSLNPKNTHLICGLPAYFPGWELNTFSNNIDTLTNRNVINNINYCDAANPFSVFYILEDIYLGLEKEEKLVIFPIGTKPHSIGAIIFLKKYPDVSIVYDNPIELSNRSKEISKVFLYEFKNGT